MLSELNGYVFIAIKEAVEAIISWFISVFKPFGISLIGQFQYVLKLESRSFDVRIWRPIKWIFMWYDVIWQHYLWSLTGSVKIFLPLRHALDCVTIRSQPFHHFCVYCTRWKKQWTKLILEKGDHKYTMAINEKHACVILKRIFDNGVCSDQITLISGKDGQR